MRVGFFVCVSVCFISEFTEPASDNFDIWWSVITRAIFSQKLIFSNYTSCKLTDTNKQRTTEDFHKIIIKNEAIPNLDILNTIRGPLIIVSG
jgi:hypothetical protein